MVDDGTRPIGAGISPDQRRTLELALGEDFEAEVTLIDPVGGRVLLGASDFLQLTARTTSRPRRQIFTARSTVARPGVYRIAVAAATTRPILPVTGAYDLWLIRASGAHLPLIPLSELRLLPAALGANYL